MNELLYRVKTIAGTVAGLLTMDELSEYEMEFYSERILEAVERVEEHSSRSVKQERCKWVLSFHTSQIPHWTSRATV